jgi:hypothetical protein
MHGIHDVFPPDEDDSNNPISEKKLKKGEGRYETRKTLLGFDIDCEAKTMWLKDANGKNSLPFSKSGFELESKRP